MAIHQSASLARVVVGVDPPGSGNTECGIVVAGIGMNGHGYVLDDLSILGTPEHWAATVIDGYNHWQSDWVVAEVNYGGDMVKSTLLTMSNGKNINIKTVRATRGKAVRAEPIAALYEQGKVHHLGRFPQLEDEMCSWVPGQGMLSPNRMDALVWALTELMLGNSGYLGVLYG